MALESPFIPLCKWGILFVPYKEMIMDPLEERILRRIPLEVLALAAAVAVVVGLVFSPLAGVLFLAGGALAALGIVSLKRSLNRVLAREKRDALRAGILFYLLRLALLLAVFFFIIYAFPDKILAFAAGFSTVIPVIGAEAALALSRFKEWKR
jgi:hypothetical protein